MEEEIKNNEVRQDKNGGNKKKTIIIISIIILLVIIVILWIFLVNKNTNEESDNESEIINTNSPYKLTSNDLEPFDLYFMQLENNGENQVYSPLSIKYALAMLSDGTNGITKEQIDNIIGEYVAKEYVNSNNMSFANGLFIKDTYQNSIKSSYINNVRNKYNADVIIDSFNDPNTLNSWISNKTFNLIPSLTDDISYLDFILVNALAIDMEWVNKIQSEYETYSVEFPHLKNTNSDSWYEFYVGNLSTTSYYGLDFANLDYDAKAVEIGAVVNRYDIVNTLGEEEIYRIVKAAYDEYSLEHDVVDGFKGDLIEEIGDFDDWFNNYYLKELDNNYGHISSSTDFEFYKDDNVSVFAKDLKEYDGTTLQYVGIMPTNGDLESYIENMTSNDINALINNLKSIELASFKDGVITEITGYIPMFKIDYELDLINDLKKLGITNVFDSNKADLSNITTDNAYINEAKHKANIEFSNDGIKASALTMLGGAGNATGPFFDYYFDFPREVIDLTFDQPFMYLIRDKETGEVWFAGTVYEPLDISDYEAELEEAERNWWLY